MDPSPSAGGDPGSSANEAGTGDEAVDFKRGQPGRRTLVAILILVVAAVAVVVLLTRDKPTSGQDSPARVRVKGEED